MEKINSKPLIIANWKMNKSISELNEWIEKLSSLNKENNHIVIAAPFTLIDSAINHIQALPISVSAQDCSNLSFNKGAFTGDISAKMLEELGCEYVILGHSERRKYHAETNIQIKQKVELALKANLKVILCIGETLEIRESGKYLDFVAAQLEESLPQNIHYENIIIAYEPVWAIGTGKNASKEQIEEMHCFLNDIVHKLFNQNVQSFDKNPKIIYGGSVTEENASNILICRNVAGLLVGGASLDAERFYKIVKHI